MNYRTSATLQWVLIMGAGVAAWKLGKQYGRNQADEMQVEYRDATTRKDIAKAIETHNQGLDDVEGSKDKK